LVAARILLSLFFTHKNFAAEYIIDFATHGVIGPLGDQFQSHEPENRRGEKGLRDGCFLLGRIWEAGTRSRFRIICPALSITFGVRAEYGPLWNRLLLHWG
jgi:hypothetical protein